MTTLDLIFVVFLGVVLVVGLGSLVYYMKEDEKK